MKNRTKDIEGYEAVVASGELSSTEVENTLLKVDAIYKLNYSEVALENEIIALGYDDVFVYVADGKVNIDILTDTFSQTEFVNVALLSKAKFDTNYIVTIHTTALSS
ncbi:MAG: SpoIIIAH-like family protein [Clostridium sp.]|nr:MAG: SpoIIIAH-like family protein [Clostridium sp.]